jgi:WD40 repeat protein
VSAVNFRAPRELISAGADGSILRWNLQPQWILARTLGGGDLSSPISDRVNSLCFSPDGKKLASGSGEPSRSGQIQVWDPVTGKLLQEYGGVHSDAVLSVSFSPSGKQLASGAADRFMKVVDLESGKVIRSFEGHTHHVLGTAWRPDGRLLASAGADNVVKIWDFETGERKKNVEGFNKEVTAICAVAGDQFLAAAGDHQVRLLNSKGEELKSFNGSADFLYALAATPDGKVVMAGGEASVLWIWNGATGELVDQVTAPQESLLQHASR